MRMIRTLSLYKLDPCESGWSGSSAICLAPIPLSMLTYRILLPDPRGGDWLADRQENELSAPAYPVWTEVM